MSKDVLFKTSAFGGFKKDEVMDFVQQVLGEKGELERLLLNNTTRNNQLSAELNNVKAEIDSLSSVRDELADSLIKVEDLTNALKEKDAIIEELNLKLAEAQRNSCSSDELDRLKAENDALKADIEKKRDMERQVGAAMLDARVHSEELIEEAKEKANNVTKAIYNAIGETAVKIDDLSTGIGEIARNFTKSVEEVELRIKVLTGDMSKTAQALISDSVSVEPKASSVDDIPVYDFNAVSVDDVIVDDEE
ncbi:MAG: DivIVA domain-containing protein [Clostridia bacterium]|nr:DivIVA domain-containing protein [Clostridia bacterium]